MSEPRPLTQAQQRAIRVVERAMVRADKAGVAICGMDDTLYAYRADDFDALKAEGVDTYDAQRMLAEHSETLDAPAYRESGAW